MKKALLFVFLTALIAITPAGAQEKVDSATITKIRAEGLQRSQVMDVFDHLSFIAVGLPGFQAVQDYNNYDVRTHHTNMDTYERAGRRRAETSSGRRCNRALSCGHEGLCTKSG